MLDLVVKILEPIVAALKSFESDTSTLSTVYSCFNKLMKQISEISWDFSNNIQQLIQKRWEYSYNPIMMAAYMLDPRFIEESKNAGMEATGYAEFTKFTDKRFGQEKSVELFVELVKFRQKALPYDNETIWMSSSTLNSSVWWQSWPNSELQQLAIDILLIPTSSAAAERNFFNFGFIHNKIRNRLRNERVKKLVYIYGNLRIFEESNKVKLKCKRNKKSMQILNNNIEEREGNEGIDDLLDFDDNIFGLESNVIDLT
jgi:hypothetical protein